MTLAGAGIKEMRQLHSKPVCVTFGSTTEIVIGGTPVLARPENTHRRCVQRLREGQVSAVSSDLSILEAFVNEEQGLELTPIQASRERYGIGLPDNRPRLCEFLKEKLVKFIDEAWEQKLKDALPGVSGKDRKPNSDALDTCETPNRALKPLTLTNPPHGTARRRVTRRPYWR
jgi:ABC-type amino acid transport substrate-binding protein